MKFQRRIGVFVGLILLVSASGMHSAQASNIAPLSTVYNTDVAAFGVGGMRGGNGQGTIAVTGISGTVYKVLLYWHGPTKNADPASNANITFSGTAISGTNIGTSSPNCWSFTNSQAYRADVTSLVPGNGNYTLANLVKPTAPGGAVDINGASLVVFYDDANPNNNRDVVIFDGNDSNVANTFDALGWNVQLSGINYASGNAKLDLIVSDGQSFPDDALILNGTTIDAGPNIFQGTTVPSASAATTDLLWDQKSYDITPQLVPGPNTLQLVTGPPLGSDCLSLIYAAVNLPAGAAPNQPPPPPAPTATVSNPNPAPGDTITVTGSGFAPNAVVTITLDPDGLLLATVTADALGNVVAIVTIPQVVTVGSATIKMSGATIGGAVRVATTDITIASVIAPVDPTPVPAPPPAVPLLTRPSFAG